MNYDETILKTRKKDSYNFDTMKAVHLLAIDPEIAFIFGSASYKMQLYPGDVDANETVNRLSSKKDIINFMTKKLQFIIFKIINTPGYYISEVKAGVDDVFDKLNIGKIEYSPSGNRVIGYNPKALEKDFYSLYENGYLTKHEIKEFLNLLTKSSFNISDFEEFQNLVRNKVILRWSPQEILKGYKRLPGNRLKSLYDALFDKTMVKIDMLAPINGKYIEVTNFFVLQYVDENGDVHNVNLPDDFANDIVNNLKNEVRKLYFSSLFFNPLKMSKRMWSMARLQKDMAMVNKLTPLLRSDASLMAQINSELETIILLFENFSNLPIKMLFNQLNGLKYRLSNLIEIDINEDQIFKKIDQITNGDLDVKTIIKHLKEIKTELKQKMINYTIIYLKSKGIFPPPDNYLF